MMDQLGIRTLRPGPSGNDQDPNHANYDESKANPFPNLPDILTLKSGKKVVTREQWARQRGNGPPGRSAAPRPASHQQ